MTAKAKRDSTARARELGAELRRIRQRSGLSGHDLARTLGWSPSKVSRMESGQRGASEVDVAVYLVSCGLVVRSELNRLVTLAREADSRYWLRPHSRELPEELRSLILQEGTANAITSYDPLIVPGLLQTEQYIRELFRWGSNRPPEDIELRVDARLARQHVLKRARSPWCKFFLHERALRAVVGGPEVMHEQLVSLLLVDSWPRCSIRVVPDAAGPYGIVGGAFKVMGYAEHPPVTYVDSWAAGLFLEEPEDVAMYREILARLDRDALDAGQSREWLAWLASEYDQMEAGRHDHPRARRADLAQEQPQQRQQR
ncbi:helix-turn-helix domain-containing protein [Amycolatopsis cihanbeyliensis]|uniref:Helix-turn-helix protein n=1 Tax=Amycolatopsis cihanbeyliensis TaxID=1128664 RepID=A0A542DMT0_AMYCI|nr:helix-turn-helix transcriptional regulator [Amycolatopsis cihanbeyliensis]TQJ04403.1 helix-turn-helix protein [Amycolatopsis cihanbeyliensis]